MDHMHRGSTIRRTARRRLPLVALCVAAALALVVPPATATHSSGSGTSEDSVHEHNGFVHKPDPNAPCATYLQFTFSANYDGSVTVQNDAHTEVGTYTGPFQVEVHSPDGAMWYENPKGSHTDSNCAAPDGDKVGGFRMVIAGTAGGKTLQCTAGVPGGAGGVEYWRVWDKVKFRAVDARCTVDNVTDSTMTIAIEEDYQPNAVPDPIFDNQHLCGPIAITPAYCVSDGSIAFS